MGKKILVGAVTILLIAALITGWYLFTLESKNLGTSAFRAVPDNASVIIRIHHLKNYTSTSLNNPIWKSCSGFPGISSLYKYLSLADSLYNRYPKPDNPFDEKDLTIAIKEENNDFQWLSLIELASLTEKMALAELIGKYFSGKGIPAEKIKDGEAELNCYSWKESDTKYFYCTTYFSGLFMGSTDPKMILQAVMALKNPNLPANPVFEKAKKSVTQNIDAQIFLNHQKLPQFARQLFNESFWDRLTGSAPLAAWSEIDLTQKTDEMILNGFSFTADMLNNHLGIFLHQQPDTFRLAHLFPAKTAFFLSYMINDNTRFFQDYEKVLAAHQGADLYRKSLSQTDSLFGVNLQKIVTENLDGAVAMVFTHDDPLIPGENKYLLLKVKSGIQAEEALSPLATLIPVHRKKDKPRNHSLYEIDPESVFKIYQTTVHDFGRAVFGEVFADVVTNYYTIYDNCLIMGASFESLGKFLRANVLHETLENDPTYRKFTTGLSDRLNIYLWTRPGRSFPFFKEMINWKTCQNIEKKESALMKIESFGWQISNENGLIYNIARLKYNPVVYESPTGVTWKSHLGGAVITRPQFVNSPSDKLHPDILLQDGAFNLLLLSHEGRILWKNKLNGPILSEIVQTDCFRNGRLQFFFSTTGALHLIDQTGNYLPHFPVILRSPATNGASVVDYERNKEYRFFIACKDHKVYLYDKKGNIVNGWDPPKSEHIVTTPVQFFRVDSKDYLVFADKNRGYILDRKGKPRVTIKGDLTFSRNPFTLLPKSGKNSAKLLTTDPKGNMIAIGFDGSLKKSPVGKFSPDHHFACENDKASNQHNYFILDGDSLVMFNKQGAMQFSRKFNHPIGLSPQFFRFPDGSLKIGVTDTTENKIYLLNSDGTIFNGFPLEGNSPFAIRFSSSTNQPFNVISGTADGYLNNYEIK